MATPYFTTPQLTQGLATVDDCLSLNWFDLAYQLNNCEVNGRAAGLDPNDIGYFKDNVMEALILVGDESPQMLFSIFEKIFGSISPQETGAKKISRIEQGRPNYWTLITNDVTSPAPGAPVTVNIGSYYSSGTTSLPQEGTFVPLPGNGFDQALISSKDDTIPYAHTMVLTPVREDQVIDLTAGTKLQLTFAKPVGNNSCPTDGELAISPGTIKTVSMGKIRADYCLQKSTMKGFFQGKLQFAFGFIDGKPVDCFQTQQDILMRRTMKMTKDRLFFTGRKVDNPAITTLIEGFEEFEGYLPSIVYGGGQVFPFDSAATGSFDPDVDLSEIVLYANANRRTTEYMFFQPKQFNINFLRKLNQFINGNPGACNFPSFSSTGMSQERMIEFLGVEAYKLHGFSFGIKQMQEWSDVTYYGTDGYPFSTMGLITPMGNIPTSDGGMVAPVEIFYPRGCGLSGGYKEVFRDMETINGCEEFQGQATEETTVMFHGLEDHYLILDSE